MAQITQSSKQLVRLRWESEHDRRKLVAEARKIVSGLGRISARQRTRAVADSLRVPLKTAQKARREAERQIADAADAAADPVVLRQRLLDDLQQYMRETEELRKSCPVDQPGAAVGVVKLKLQIRLTMAQFEGVKPAEPEVDRGRAKPAVFEFGGDEGDDDADDGS